MPNIILFILFVYDYYMNNGVITKVFYYLPFYLVYNLWYKSSNFLCNSRFQFDRILHEMYYCRDIIIYREVTREEFVVLEHYIGRGFVYEYTTEDMINPVHSLILYKRFTRAENQYENGKIVFSNNYIGYDFHLTEEELKEFENED